MNTRDIAQKQQLDVLVAAIDNYLAWRKYKSVPDDRGYASTLFTWLRHYTVFGEVRANHLKNSLLSDLNSDPIKLLQEHFKKDSKINNHSLDTYLLEEILKNRNLFLVPIEVTTLDTVISRAGLRKIILEQETKDRSEYVYLVGKRYEEDINAEDYLKKACDFYRVALKGGNTAAQDALNKLAIYGNAEAQYILGIEYYHRKRNFKVAINLCIQAAEKGHLNAINYLHTTDFGAEYYLMIAKKYDDADGVVKNMASALIFYKKACALNNKDAAFRLGQLYQPNLDLIDSKPDTIEFKGVGKDAHQSFDYYLIAARQKDQAALNSMVMIAENFDDDVLRFKLAKLYFGIFTNHTFALTRLKVLADRNFQAAISQLSVLTKKNAEYAYIVGQLYEVNVSNEDHLKKACDYYTTAMLRDHEAALEALNRLAYSGNAEAQYVLGVEYHHRKSKFRAAINCCMCAANQGHLKATHYLFETDFSVECYLMIAKRYDEGRGVTRDIASALIFYKKACALDNKDAAFRLGQLYQPHLDLIDSEPDTVEFQEVEKDAHQSFDYYLIAAQQNDQAALNRMVMIAENFDDDVLRFKLAKLYFDIFSNPSFALTRLKVLADRNFQAAISQLSVLTKKNAEYAYIVGKLYEEDVSAKDYLKKACDFYKVALKGGNKAAQDALINLCLLAADQGHVEATDYLNKTDFGVEYYLIIAEKYEQGEGVQRNINLVIKFLQKAMEQKHAEAAFRLGEIYLSHPDIETNKKRAYGCFVKAASWGHPEALVKLVCQASSGEADAQYYLGCEYHHFRQARFEAIDWAMLAADQGHEKAKMYLQQTIFPAEIHKHIARKYEQGDGAKKNTEQAIRYYTKAIHLQDEDSAVALGELYLAHGEFVENKNEAFIAFIKAVQLGHMDSLVTLECLADDVDPELQLYLANLYQQTPLNNQEKAIYWYQQAREGGCVEAEKYLAKKEVYHA